MKNCVGQVVRGEDFWDRKVELESMWDAIDSGSHILLVAPRQVGKTSIKPKTTMANIKNYSRCNDELVSELLEQKKYINLKLSSSAF